MAKDRVSLKQKWLLLDKKRAGIHSAAYIAKLAMLTALAFILYAYVKFPVPVLFPSFLEIQISDLPALLAGFAMGPISGCIVVVLKCVLKFAIAGTGTGFVGEATDILLGVAFVLPAALIYKYKKDVKHALWGLIVGTFVVTGVAILVNRFISIPLYVKLFFHGNFDILVGIVKDTFKSLDVNKDNFYFYYLLVGVLPFNIFRCIIVAGLTFALYKPLSKILHWNGESWRQKSVGEEAEEFEPIIFTSNSIEDTYAFALVFADMLYGGEIVLLNGDLGAGKTTFTKGLARALGITDEVTSPTFTIMNVYTSGRLKLNHLDMYRIENEDELVELGVSEAVGEEGAVTVIEWNKLGDLYGKVFNVDIKALGEMTREFYITMKNNDSSMPSEDFELEDLSPSSDEDSQENPTEE